LPERETEQEDPPRLKNPRQLVKPSSELVDVLQDSAAIDASIGTVLNFGHRANVDQKVAVLRREDLRGRIRTRSRKIVTVEATFMVAVVTAADRENCPADIAAVLTEPLVGFLSQRGRPLRTGLLIV
jgi:hypothetical protein